MSDHYADKIKHTHCDGKLNKYMADRLLGSVDSGITDDLFEELIQDAITASNFGVNTDKEYTIYFFIDHLIDDILDDTFGVSIDRDNRDNLCRFIFSHKDDEDHTLDDLTDYRILTHKWLNNRLDKNAHPNISGKDDRSPIDDLDKWISTLKSIYRSIHNGSKNRQTAIEHFTKDWDNNEKYRFVNWMRYYEEGTTEKYNVKNAKLNKQANLPPIPQSWLNNEDRASDGMYMTTYKENNSDDGKTERQRELEKAKMFKLKMRSRLRALKKLVDKYCDILPKHNLDNIYDEMHSLEKSIGRLDVYASIHDCIIRSANRINSFGFREGADFLKKVADEPVGTAQGQTSSASVNTIINRLEVISKLLKSRDTIRELARVDILLNDIGLASYFPELTDAQSKLIEAFGYASNKIESIVAKLRGSEPPSKQSIQQTPVAPAQPKLPQPPSVPQAPIDTGDALNKPVGKVQTELPKKME